MRAAVDSAMWADLRLISAARHHHEIQPTCLRLPGAEPTRIDTKMGSRAAMVADQRCGAIQLLLPLRKALRATFDWTVLVEVRWAVIGSPVFILESPAPRPGRRSVGGSD